MSPQEEQERYRYLQLKMKMGSQPSPMTTQAQQRPGRQFESFPEITDIAQSNRSLPGKLWEGLQVPSQMSRRGLSSIANMIPKPEPTGNKFMDILKGAPRIAGETMAEAAPGFVDRTSLLTAAAGPAMRTAAPALRWGGETAGEWAGLKPGRLEAAFKDPSLIFSKGKAAARPFYAGAQAEIEGSQLINKTSTNLRLISNAEKMAKAGRLSEAEALEARKAADVLKGSKTVNQTWLAGKRKLFDSIAKESSDISKGDIAYKRGVIAQDLRSVFPKNVGGRSSPFKVGEGMMLTKMLGPAGKVLAAMMSPLALGSTATAAGAVSKYPSATVALQQLISRLMSQQNGQPPQP